MTKFGDMVYALGGIPTIGGGEIPASTGNYYFVDSVNGNAGNTGKTPEAALATIDQAINKCTANQGDVIIVMPGHAETISNGTSLVPDVAGISIIGLGHGSDAPEITFDNTASEIIITGESTYIRNLRFIAGVSAIVTGVDIDANHVTLENCTFDFSTTAFDFLIMIDIDAFDYACILGCTLRAENATAGAARGIRLDDANHVTIERCIITGDFSAAAIEQASADAPGVNLLVKDCIIYNDDTANADNGIALQEAYTGMLIRNAVGSLEGTAPEGAIDPGSCLCIENYVCDGVDQSGTIVPVTLST